MNWNYTRERPGSYGILVLLCLVFFGIGIIQKSAVFTAPLAGLLLMGLYFGFAEIFVLSLMCGLMLLFRGSETLSNLWPLPTAIALAIVLLTSRLFPFTRGILDWMKKGEWGPRQIVTMSIIVAISTLSLVCWYVTVKPDVSDIARRVIHVSPVALILIGIVFSVSNAICEEFVWRGIIFDALEKAFSSAVLVNIIQSLSFGMAHFGGFPRGISGIVPATVYGCMMGYVRQEAKGMLAPIACHVFADAVIYSILVSAAFRD